MEISTLFSPPYLPFTSIPCRGTMQRGKEVKRLVEKVTCTSDDERVRFEKEGYVVVSVGYFPENGKPIYTMERGSDWSQKLGSK